MAATMSSIRTSFRVPRMSTPMRGASVGAAGRVDLRHQEHGRHLGRGAQPHRILVQRRIAGHGADGSELTVAEILDVVALHVRRIRIEEEAPVRLVAAEQCRRIGARRP